MARKRRRGARIERKGLTGCGKPVSSTASFPPTGIRADCQNEPDHFWEQKVELWLCALEQLHGESGQVRETLDTTEVF